MDKELERALKLERKRQIDNIELIASENYASKYVRKLQGSILTNKYAEGYSGKRYYGGCEYIDIFENKAIESVYRALLNHGDKVMGMNLSDGGHLTHGHPLSFSGMDYTIVDYKVDENGYINYDEVEKIAKKEKPKMIIAGASAYPRKIDFKRFGEIAHSVGAILMVDMAHLAGLVATGLHENPCMYADVVTSTKHKTLRGPRGGIILTNSEEIIQKINKTVFPGIQGGPLMHVIGAKAECFYEALKPEFKTYQKQVLKNIKAMSDEFIKLGMKVVSGGTDNHLILLNVYDSLGITGKEAEKLLDKCHITVNKNTIPGEKLSPMKASGIRIGSPAMTTRGFKEKEFVTIAKYIYEILTNKDNEKKLKEVAKKVVMLGRKFPINNI